MAGTVPHSVDAVDASFPSYWHWFDCTGNPRSRRPAIALECLLSLTAQVRDREGSRAKVGQRRHAGEARNVKSADASDDWRTWRLRLSRMIAQHGPNNEVAIVAESGHSIYWEQPEVFNRTVLEFIGRYPKLIGEA